MELVNCFKSRVILLFVIIFLIIPCGGITAQQQPDYASDCIDNNPEIFWDNIDYAVEEMQDLFNAYRQNGTIKKEGFAEILFTGNIELVSIESKYLNLFVYLSSISGKDIRMIAPGLYIYLMKDVVRLVEYYLHFINEYKNTRANEVFAYWPVYNCYKISSNLSKLYDKESMKFLQDEKAVLTDYPNTQTAAIITIKDALIKAAGSLYNILNKKTVAECIEEFRAEEE